MKLKSLKYIIAILLIPFCSFADESLISENYQPEDLEEELKSLNRSIELYFTQMFSLKTVLALNNLKVTSPMFSLKTVLALNNLKVTSPRSKMHIEDLKTLETLESSKLEIINLLEIYRHRIESLAVEVELYSETESKTSNLEKLEKAKFLYNMALTNSFLPRYGEPSRGLISKLFVVTEPQYVEELISRTDALRLFFLDFEINENIPKSILNAKYRLQEIVKAYNKIAKNNNSLRGSNLFQTYSKIPKLNTYKEADLYQSIIKGEDFATNHFTGTITCAGLFNI